MKLKLFIMAILFYFFSAYSWSQNINCQKQLESLKSNIKKDSTQLSTLLKDFSDLKNKITVTASNDSIIDNLKSTQKSISDLKKNINTNIDTFINLKDICLNSQALTEQEVSNLIKDIDLNKYDEDSSKAESIEKQTYIYFNEDQIIKEDVITNDNIQGKILNDIISQTNQESYLGDITIPKNDEEFYFYKWMKKTSNETKRKIINNINNLERRIKLNNDTILEDSLKLSKKRLEEINNEKESYKKTAKMFKFKSIDVQIYDGNFYDIRLKIEYNNQQYLFENFKSVSFFRFNKMAKNNYLMYSNKQPYGIEENLHEIEGLKIRLSDVLYYEYKIGNNYIPNDLLLELPKKDIDNKQTNLNAPTTYQIKENTYLDKIIELRAYTDFLALFNDADNGLLQIEGSAKFYIFPFSRQLFNYTGQVEFLKSAIPYVNYARFEDGKGLAEATTGVFNQELDVIEKRYLSMGIKLNMIEIYHKNYPIKANIFGVADYNISKAQNDMLDPENIKSLGYGFGLNIATKRFNNFGFSYNMEFKWFDLENFNTTSNINTEINVPIFKNEAEVFYHPTDNPNQSIFVRLRTFNYKGNKNDEAFYQFQFGYRFSLGSRSVKK